MTSCPYCNAPNQAGLCAVCCAPIASQGEPQAAESSIDTIDAAELSTTTLPIAPHVVQGVIPRGLSVLAGRPKVGKSWAAADLALAVASGKPWNGCAVDAGPVLYLALEDTHARLQQRIGSMTKSPPSTLLFATACDGGIVALGAWIEKRQPKLAIIDTLQIWRGGRGSSYARDYAEGVSLKKLADKHNCAVLVIHHTTKIAKGSPLDSVSGSTGLTGAADAIMVLGTNAGRGALWLTGRDIPTAVVPLEWANHRWRIASAPTKQIAGPKYVNDKPTFMGMPSY